MTIYSWPSPGQNEDSIAGSRLAGEIHDLGIPAYAFATARDAALAEAVYRTRTGEFVDLSATGTVDFTGATVSGLGTVFGSLDINGGTIDGTVIGGSSPAAGTFTTLAATTVSGTPTWSSSQAITRSTAAQPNVTSLGTLTGLEVLDGSSLWDDDGEPNFRAAALRSDTPPSGSTNHPHSFKLEVDTALATGNIGLISVLWQSFDTGTQSSFGMAIEGFVHAGGDGATTGDLSAVAGQTTIFDAATVTWARNIVGGALNKNGAATGSITNAAQIFASSIGTGTNRYGFYCQDISGGTLNYAIYTNAGAVRLGGLPTSDPAVAGELWIDTSAARVVKVSAG